MPYLSTVEVSWSW